MEILNLEPFLQNILWIMREQPLYLFQASEQHWECNNFVPQLGNLFGGKYLFNNFWLKLSQVVKLRGGNMSNYAITESIKVKEKCLSRITSLEIPWYLIVAHIQKHRDMSIWIACWFLKDLQWTSRTFYYVHFQVKISLSNCLC